MRPLIVLVVAMIFAHSAPAAKQRHCILRIHTEANARDTGSFASSVKAQLSGKEIAIEKMPRISEQDVVAFKPYSLNNGEFGALLQLDDHGRIALDTLSIEKRGSYLFIFVNGRAITEMQIDKRVSDGKIYIPAGLSAADIALMHKDWKLIGAKRR